MEEITVNHETTDNSLVEAIKHHTSEITTGYYVTNSYLAGPRILFRTKTKGYISFNIEVEKNGRPQLGIFNGLVPFPLIQDGINKLKESEYDFMFARVDGLSKCLVGNF